MRKMRSTWPQYLTSIPLFTMCFILDLPITPGHDIARRQQQGFGGMLSFEIKGGEAAVRAFLEHLRYFSLAESLGGVESLICHPASMTHAPMSEEALAKAGVSQDLIRLSVGIESGEDLAADVLDALEAASNAVELKPVAAGVR